MSQGWPMKKILTLGFLLLGLQPLSAQPFPFYDLNYYDSPKCIKEKANSFAKNTHTKQTRRSRRQINMPGSESCRAVFTRRHDQAVGHNSI